MDFTSVFDKLKEFFTTLKEKITSAVIKPVAKLVTKLYEENKKLFFIICGLVVLILLCIILLICASGKSKSKKNETKIIEQPLVLTEELQIPQGPDMPDGYNISRKTTSAWSVEDGEQWFTVPSEKEIDALSQSNKNLINDLIGAAP